MVIISPIPGQEERNSDHLLEDGAAIKCNEMTTIPYKIDTLLERSARLAAMQRAARKLGRPDAARTIARVLIEDHLEPMHLGRRGARGDCTGGIGRDSIMDSAVAAKKSSPAISLGSRHVALPIRGGLQRPRPARRRTGRARKRTRTWCRRARPPSSGTRHPEDFQRCRELGLNAFRLGIEWSRVQPALRNEAGSAPDFDSAALDHYAENVRRVPAQRLEPGRHAPPLRASRVAGRDPWMKAETPALFETYVKYAVTHVK